MAGARLITKKRLLVIPFLLLILLLAVPILALSPALPRADDPAAARVHEVFQTLLEILEDEPEAPPPSRGRSWSERRRKPATGGTERRSPAKRSRR